MYYCIYMACADGISSNILSSFSRSDQFVQIPELLQFSTDDGDLLHIWCDVNKIQMQLTAANKKMIAFPFLEKLCFDLEADRLSQVKWNIQAKIKGHVKLCFLQVVLYEQQLVTATGSPLWCDLDDLVEPNKLPVDNESSPRLISDVIHELADALPFAGCLADIFVDLPENFNSSNEGFLPLYGAVRRLKDWHNAAVTFLYKGDNPSNDNDFCDIMPGIHTGSFDNLDIPDQTIWRGKISVVDKTVNRGFILPGLEIQHNKCGPIKYPKRGVCDAVLGRMLEVLDEVDISTVPPYMFTSNIFMLSQNYHHPHASVFMEHIRTSQSGVLMRLSCCHGVSSDVNCGDKYLNTTLWKESIIADITFIQEPEEELLPGHEFVHFLAYCKEESPDILLHQLVSPHHLNGQIFDMIYHNSLLTPAESTEEDLSFLSELPVLSNQTLDNMMASLQHIQIKVLTDWLEDRQKCGKPTMVQLSDLHQFLYDIQMVFLEKIKHCFPCHQFKDHHLEETQTCSELEKSPSTWTERCLLVYQESQRKSFNRLQSTESVAMSSPVQSEDMPSTIDIHGFLKLFQHDGNPVASKLSPVRKRHPSRSLRLQNSTEVKKSAWPDCHYLPHFDVYYNIDKRAEKQEGQSYKLREKHIKAETFTSGPSTIFRLPKKKSHEISTSKGKSDVSLKKSPRKSVGSKLTPPKKSVRSGLFSPRKSAGRGLLSPKQPMKKTALLSPRKHVLKGGYLLSPTRKSPRKKIKTDLNTSLPSTGYAKPKAVDKLKQMEKEKNKRRHSVGDVDMFKKAKDSAGRKSLPSADDSLDTSIGLNDSQRRKESRSERHKRKLQEIVNDVLKQYGVDNNIFQACSNKLFKVTKLFVMDLPTSQNLKQEMRNIAEGQVEQVVNLERRRKSIGDCSKNK